METATNIEGSRIASWFDFAGVWMRSWRDRVQVTLPLQAGRPFKELNRELAWYPGNHNYKVFGQQILPGVQLYRRWKTLSPFYSNPLESFLDIGCSKGYFVMEAAQRPTCRVSVGIDVFERSLSSARQVKDLLGQGNASFHMVGLGAVADDVARFGGPFQTVLLINTYHYLFWGSPLDRTAFQSHREIFSRLHTVCSERVVFASPLEIDQCPGTVKEAAAAAGNDLGYNEANFVEAAGEFFRVERTGRLARRPSFVLHRKG